MDQDGGVGRYIVLPHTTKRRTTTNLKAKNNQNCQKNKLYGSLTARELKKKHSSSMVGAAGEVAWKGGGPAGEVVARGLGNPTFTC